MLYQTLNVPLQEIQLENIPNRLYILREDLIHTYLSGNKWRKLKYNLLMAKELGKTHLLTFGGAFSNHIYAVAAAGKLFNFKTIGLIRGEETLPLNTTLKFAEENSMKLVYLDRSTYRTKTSLAFLADLQAQYGEKTYILPEGGTNLLAVKGCTEIVENISINYDYICCACGTGGTLAGIIAGLQGTKQVIGFPVLKNGLFLADEIEKLIADYNGETYQNWQLNPDYHFGGYAKNTPVLTDFINNFQSKYNIPIEFVYTGKMLYGVFELLKQGFFAPHTTIIAVHTGGLRE
jgi:1-aminocyclopropane-1-carboxylate deaminase/D-cysteine desulfhydrase-like pyridoxal-dependent ACC family enzyme